MTDTAEAQSDRPGCVKSCLAAAPRDPSAGGAGDGVGQVRVQRRDRLGGVVHEYVLAA